MSLGKNVRVLRLEKGISQENFAQTMGVSQKTVSAWECDRCEPNLNMVRKITKFFGASIDDPCEDDMAPLTLDYDLNSLSLKDIDKVKLFIKFLKFTKKT